MELTGHVIVVLLALVGVAGAHGWNTRSPTAGLDLALSAAGFAGVVAGPAGWRFKVLVVVLTALAVVLARAGLRVRALAHGRRAVEGTP